MLFSCDNYLDVNTNPNQVTYSGLQPKDLLSAAQTNTFRTQATTMNELGNVFMNSWAANVASFTGGFANEYQLNINNTFYNGIWDGLYRGVNNFQLISQYPNPNGVYDYYIAVSKICKAHYMQYIVDLYGDAPYTTAFLGTANTTPSYNDDQFIYRQLISELEQARTLIANADPAKVEDIAAVDTMLGGDMAKWTQFANTVELRMLLRMSNSTGAVATYRDSKLASLPQNFVTADVTINPGYAGVSPTAAQANPFFNTFAYSGGTATQNWTFICMSGHAYKFLRNNAASNGTDVVPGSGTVYPGIADARAGRLFRGTLKGVTQGSNLVDVPSSGTPARMGYGLLNPYIAQPEPVAFISDLELMASNNGFVMTLSESAFLQAEAAVRYPAIFSGASSNFNTGIDASFARLGVASAATAAATYRTSISAKPGLGWTASTTDDLKIKAIMTQKWIALMGVHGVESYIDYTRTGYPVTPLATTAPAGLRKPYRLIYASSEYVANSANVPNVSTADVFTINTTSPFWLQGNPALGN